MKSATATKPSIQKPTKDIPVLMDVLVEKRLKLQSNKLNQATPLNSQLANQLRELRKVNAKLQIKNQQAQRYAERVQADRDVFRKQVIRLLHRSKLLEQQLEERHKPAWNKNLSLESIKNKTSNIKVIKNHCSVLLKITYTIVLQKSCQIKEIMEKRNTRRLKSQGSASDKDLRKSFNKNRSDRKKEIEKQHNGVKKHALKKVIKHEYIEI